MVFAVVSSDTSSPFQVYVSLFVCDDCAPVRTEPLTTKMVAEAAIRVHRVDIASSCILSRLLSRAVDVC